MMKNKRFSRSERPTFIIKDPTVSALTLGVMNRNIRLFVQHIEVRDAVVGSGNPYTGSATDRLTTDPKFFLGQRFAKRRPQFFQFRAFGNLRIKKRELIPAQAPDKTMGGFKPFQDLSHMNENIVAGLMTVVIINALEIIQIDKKEPHKPMVIMPF
ncbi:hypothetical protein EVA_06720 [gut metagenome]|uniref:Uncharacterized protein n=1 Tax=gut metagenome TaxID=749906 RepID=J9GCW1_9ZZZZ